MPMITRSISPVNISQGRLPPGIQSNELEWVANGTMANLMRQMSSLTQHACQIFGDVHKEITSHDRRIERIHDRISRLHLASPQEVSAAPASLDGKRKAFKSLNIIDQHTLDRQTLPPAIAELYNKCEDPPQLDLLNPFRDDSKSALKYYTNPDYFFDLWKEEMLKEAPLDNRKTARSARSPSGDRNASPSRRRRQRTSTSATRQQPSGITPIQSNVVLGHYQSKINQQNGEFMHFPSEYQAPQLLRNHNHASEMPPPPGMSIHSVSQTRVAPARPQPSVHPSQPNHGHDMTTNFQGLNLTQAHDLGLIDADDDELPPPPPPLSDHTSLLPNLNSPQSYSSASTMPVTSLPITPMKLIEAPAAHHHQDNELPPPPAAVVMATTAPPPPPPPPPPPISLMTASTIQATSFGGSGTAPTGSKSTAPAPKDPSTARVNLLSQIQAGITLKKVQLQKEKEEEKAALEKGHDVAAVLRQRMRNVNAHASDDEATDDSDSWGD